MTSSASRKLRRLEQKSVPSASKALQGLSHVTDLASKIDQFVAASEKMQELAEQYVGLDELQELSASAKKVADEVQQRLDLVEKNLVAQQEATLQVLFYFKQFFTEGGEVHSKLSKLEAKLLQADEPR